MRVNNEVSVCDKKGIPTRLYIAKTIVYYYIQKYIHPII